MAENRFRRRWNLPQKWIFLKQLLCLFKQPTLSLALARARSARDSLTTAPAGDSLFREGSWHSTSPLGGCSWLPSLLFGSRLFCQRSSSSSPAPSCTCFCLTTAATTSSSPKKTSFLPPCERLA